MPAPWSARSARASAVRPRKLELVLGAAQRASFACPSWPGSPRREEAPTSPALRWRCRREIDNVAGVPPRPPRVRGPDRHLHLDHGPTARRRRRRRAGRMTASEFGGLNVSTTRLNGTTHNPWRLGRTAGGSSGGSAAAVAGHPALGDGGDGGDRPDPAAFNGLVGMKGTAGRIPRGPRTMISPHGRHRLPVPVRPRRGPVLRRLCRPRQPRPVQPSRRSSWESATSAPTTSPASAWWSLRPWVRPSSDRRSRPPSRRCPPRSSATPGSSRSTCRSSYRGWASSGRSQTWPPSEPSSSSCGRGAPTCSPSRSRSASSSPTPP